MILNLTFVCLFHYYHEPRGSCYFCYIIVLVAALIHNNTDLIVPPQEGLNIMHCAAINNQTEIIEYIMNDLQMKELDKEDQVSTSLIFINQLHNSLSE